MIDPSDWQIIVSAFCALVLGALMMALIYNKNFRQDLAASQGKANLFNLISVEGALVLALSALFFYGMIHPVRHPLQSFQSKMDMAGIAVQRPDELLELYRQSQRTLAEQTALIDDQARRMAGLQFQYSDYISKAEIAEFIVSLPPEHDISRSLYDLPRKAVGPWSPFAKSTTISVSIPARDIAPGQAATCQSLHGDSYELVSALAQQSHFGEPVQVTATELIYRASDCEQRVSYDMQISCSDARKLFTDLVLTCNARGEALWTHTRPEKLEVNMVNLGQGI